MIWATWQSERARHRGRRRPWERKTAIQAGPTEPMLRDDALDQYAGEWIVFKILESDDRRLNHRGIVVAHGGPEAPMREIASRLFRDEPGVRVIVEYSHGRPFQSAEEFREAIHEYFSVHDLEDWLDG